MDKFFSDVQKKQKKPESEPAKLESSEVPPKKAILKGVVLGKDGKP